MPHPSSEMERTEDQQVEGRPIRPTGYQISSVPQSVPNIVNCSRNLIPRPDAVMQRRGIRSRDTSQTSPMEMPCKLGIVLFFPAHWGIERFDDHTIRWLMNGATTGFENRFFCGRSFSRLSLASIQLVSEKQWKSAWAATMYRRL